jgi:hypothetical protein
MFGVIAVAADTFGVMEKPQKKRRKRRKKRKKRKKRSKIQF